MPTKKTSKKTTTSSKKSNSGLDFQRLIQTSNSYKSLIYGIITVVVLFAVIVLGIRTLSQNQQKDIDQGAEVTQESDANMYTVAEGDTLWSIAEKKYGDGFKWTEIAKANNIKEGGVIEKGTKLRLPEISQTQTSPAVTVTPSAAMQPTVTQTTVKPTATPTVAMQKQTMTSTQPKITGTSYTVVAGDTLWDIAIRAYGDGYRWPEIAKNNNIANPNLIYVGNVIKLSR